MVRVYTAPDSTIVHLARNVLENSGISCVIRGEHLASAMGGVAPIDAWLELWVVEEMHAREAEALLREMLSDDAERPREAWICPDCIEWREAQFSHCWKCGSERLR